jgi:adenylosuccinate synthase
MNLEERLGENNIIFEGIKDIPRIPELDFQPTQDYLVSSMEEVLYDIIEMYQVLVVSGAFFGDEGKGKLVDAIARHPEIMWVMRANSGQNAGHTVTIDGVEYVFHLAPSGIMVPGKKCLVNSECVMDPVPFMEQEIQKLIDNNKPYDDLFIGNVHITLPTDKLMDLLGKPPNSSTLQGISDVHAAKARKQGIRMDHLFGSEEVLDGRLSKAMEPYFGMLAFKGWQEDYVMKRCEAMNTEKITRFPAHVLEFVEAGKGSASMQTRIAKKVAYLKDLYRKTIVDNPLFPKRADTSFMLRQGLRKGEKALIECAQSRGLDNAYDKHWSSATSASTGSAGTKASASYNQEKHPTKTINIGKVPPSRVGRGANPIGLVPQTWFSDQGIDTLDKLAGKCEDVDEIERLYFSAVQDNGVFKPTVYKDKDGSELLVNEALSIAWSRKYGEKGATTQKPRVLGFFDLVMHYEVNDVQGPYLSISALDRFDECDKVAVVVGYVYHDDKTVMMESHGKLYRNGDIIRPGDQMPTEQVLKYCHPIMKVMDGWKGSPISSKVMKPDDPLPEQVKRFIGIIEHFTGAEVIAIGNGKEAGDIKYIKRVEGFF